MERDDRGPYGWTLYLELCGSLFRFIPAILPAVLIVGLGGLFALFGLDGIGLLSDAEAERWYDGLIQAVLVSAGVFAVLPVLLSVLTLWGLRGGFGLTAKELDARPPSNREWRVIADAVQRVLAEAPAGTIGPERWLVLDKVDLNAAVMGRALYIHRALIHSEYLDAVVAHELGHLNNGDGRLILALRRLVPPPFSFFTFAGNGFLPLLMMLSGGGFGLLLTTPWWNRYWREREYLADRFAYECGQAVGLIELLELYQFFDVAVPFGFLWRSHPHHEERIDRLLGYLEIEFEEEEERSPNLPATAGGRPREIPSAVVEPDPDNPVWPEADQWLDDETNLYAAALRAWHGYCQQGRGAALVNWERQDAVGYFDYAAAQESYGQADWELKEQWSWHIDQLDPERAFVVVMVDSSGTQRSSHYRVTLTGDMMLRDL